MDDDTQARMRTAVLVFNAVFVYFFVLFWCAQELYTQRIYMRV